MAGSLGADIAFMLNNIQALRAFAAINVVLLHIIAQPGYFISGESILYKLQGWGANGVDIFFVISGFVMLHTQFLSRKSPLNFLKSRLIRIVPVYWAVTALIVAFMLVFSANFRGNSEAPVWVVSSFLFITQFFDKRPLVEVGWTLEWEMLFYLLFSIGLCFKSWRFIGFFIVVSLVIVAVVSQQFIVLEFVFGTVVALFFHKKNFSKKTGLAFLAFGVALLLLSLLPAVHELNLNRILIWGIPSFFIVLGGVLSPQISNSFLSYLGNASYSIYLAQALTIPIFFKLFGGVLQDFGNDFFSVTCLVFSVFFGCIMHSYLERPITEKFRKFAAL